MFKLKTFSHSLFRLTKLQTGRRVSIYKQWRPLLVAHGMTEALAYLDRALAHEARTTQLDSRWGASTRRRYSEDLPAVDALVDSLLYAIVDFVNAQTRGLQPGDPLVESATALVRELFPGGVQAIASISFVEQATACEVVVAKLRGELAPHVTRLGLERLVSRLADAVAEYRVLVDGGNGQVLYEQVRDAHHRGLDYLAEILCMIVARFHDADDAHHVAARNAFMKPLAEHHQQACEDRRLRRSRNAATDEPAADEPAADEPAADEPAADEPAADEPAAGGIDGRVG